MKQMNLKTKAIISLLSLPVMIAASACSQQDPLEAKIVAKMGEYETARALMIERNYLSTNPITREEWEALFISNPDGPFSETDFEQLQERQTSIILQSKTIAEENSVIDLNLLRDDIPALADFCYQIPKGGMLHVHPYGLFTREIVTEILTEYNPVIEQEYFITTVKNQNQVLYDHEIVALRSLPGSSAFLDLTPAEQSLFIDFFFLPTDPVSHDFTRFDAIFAFVIWMVEDDFLNEKMERLYLDFLHRAADHGISYIEFTNGYPASPASIELLTSWSAKFLEETGVVVRWNLGMVRFLPGEVIADYFKSWNALLAENPTDAIVGIDMYAIERGNPALEKAQHSYGYLVGYNNEHENHPLDMTMHSGEMGDPRNVRDALIMGVSRLGHGVLLDQDPIAIEYVRRHNIGIEMNINSNHQLSVHDKNKAPHPFLKFLRLGIPVSLSTDNDGIFDTNRSKECIAAVSTTDVSYNELRALSYNSITTSFASNATKQVLINDLNSRFIDFEKEYAN
jgi:adenosine deaminase CECR1